MATKVTECHLTNRTAPAHVSHSVCEIITLAKLEQPRYAPEVRQTSFNAPLQTPSQMWAENVLKICTSKPMRDCENEALERKQNFIGFQKFNLKHVCPSKMMERASRLRLISTFMLRFSSIKINEIQTFCGDLKFSFRLPSYNNTDKSLEPGRQNESIRRLITQTCSRPKTPGYISTWWIW